MAASSYRWHRQTITETFERIQNGVAPWVAIGDFLDDWRRSAVKDRYELVEAPIAPAPFKMSNIYGGDRMLDRV